MQWVFRFEDGKDEFVEVDDGTVPPNIGEKLDFTGKVRPGYYIVHERSFESILPEKHASALKYGWRFHLKERQ